MCPFVLHLYYGGTDKLWRKISQFLLQWGPRYFRSVSGDINHKNLAGTTNLSHYIGVWVQTPAAMTSILSCLHISTWTMSKYPHMSNKGVASREGGWGWGGVGSPGHQSRRGSKQDDKMEVLNLKNLIFFAQNISNFWADIRKSNK